MGPVLIPEPWGACEGWARKAAGKTQSRDTYTQGSQEAGPGTKVSEFSSLELTYHLIYCITWGRRGRFAGHRNLLLICMKWTLVHSGYIQGPDEVRRAVRPRTAGPASVNPYFSSIWNV